MYSRSRSILDLALNKTAGRESGDEPGPTEEPPRKQANRTKAS
jgi:hypothetical protein